MEPFDSIKLTVNVVRFNAVLEPFTKWLHWRNQRFYANKLTGLRNLFSKLQAGGATG